MGMLGVVSACLVLDNKGEKYTMKLKYVLEMVDMGDEIVAVPVGEKAQEMGGILKLNDSGKLICELLKEDTSEAFVIDKLAQSYDNSRDELQKYVHSFLSELRELDLLLK